MKKPKQPKCPRCGRPSKLIGTNLYRCTYGCGLHDDEPDEGGSYSTDPTRRIENQEELQKARRENDRMHRRR